VHIGVFEQTKEDKLKAIIQELGFTGDVIYLFKEGEPVKVLSSICDENQIELLILGAAKRERLLKHYLGSVARKLTKKVKCSVFLLMNQSQKEIHRKHIVVNGLKSQDSHRTISTAFYVAHSLDSKKLTIVEEIDNNHIKVDDDRSLRRAAINHQRKNIQEDLRIKKIITTIPLDFKKNVEVKLQGIFGKSSYSIGHYARVVRADLLIMHKPKNLRFVKRILADDISFILSELPTDVLIIK